jgi:hypothetical protein
VEKGGAMNLAASDSKGEIDEEEFKAKSKFLKEQ